MKTLTKYLGIALLLLVTVLLVKTCTLHSRQPAVRSHPIVVADSGAVARLQQAVQLATVSYDDSARRDTAAFARFHLLLRDSFPTVHAKMQLTHIGRFALLYRLTGSNPSLKPVVLMAHQDVVPADAATWIHPPFSGMVYRDSIWGRGTLDNKGSLMAIMEAMERKLAAGYAPQRTIYLAFGHDEETVGSGAKAIARYLKQNGVEAEMVLDEGMVITQGMVPLVDSPVALVGTSEKGYATIRMEVDVNGGHSSTPKPETAIGILAEALTRVNSHLPSARFSPPVNDFLSFLGPEIGWPAKVVFANPWLFNPIIKNIYTNTPAGNALVSTTLVPTIASAGDKENAIPSVAVAMLNSRILPGDTPESVLAHVKKVVKRDEVKLSIVSGRNPSPVSPVEVDAYRRLSDAIALQFPKTLVMPSLMLAASDSRSFAIVSKNVYRFAPYRLTNDDLNRIHGINERIAVSDYLAMIGFYQQVLVVFER